MSDSPIFDQLQAEFVAESQYCGLRIGPPAGEYFITADVIDDAFKTTGKVTRMVEVEEPVKPVFLEMTDSAKDAPMVLEMNGPKFSDDTIDASSVLEINLAKVRENASVKANSVQVFPKLYVVEGAPELVNLSEVKDEDPTLVQEETEMERTISIPKFEHEEAKPPSIALDETQFIPAVKDDYEESAPASEKPADDKNHVVPIRKPKALHKTAHKKNSATGTLSWFTNHRAA